MDPSIMKLLEDDEDETMHSGADVEAFTAALNRDIEGDTSMSQPLDSDAVVSQGSNHTSSQLFSQWQTSQDVNENHRIQEDQNSLQQHEQHSPKMESKQHGSGAENQQHIDASEELKRLPLEVKQSQADHGQQQTEQIPFQFSQPLSLQPKNLQDDQRQQQGDQTSLQFSQSSGMDISEKNIALIQDPSRVQNPESESHYSTLQKMNNQPGTATDQTSNPINRGKQVPFALLLPVIIPQLDKDRAMQLTTLYAKLKKNEIPKEGFVRHMRGIVGDQMLKLAVMKLHTQAARSSQTGSNQFQLQSQAAAQQQNLKVPSTGATQFTEPRPSAQLHQKIHSSPAGASHIASSAGQVQTGSSYSAGEYSAQKSRGMERQPDSHGLQVSQMTSSCLNIGNYENGHSTTLIQGLNEQQQQHMHFPSSSFPMHGSSGATYHNFSGTSLNSSASSLRPQAHDPQMRQISLHQNMGSTQAMSMMSVPNFAQTSVSDTKRVLSGSFSHLTSNSTLHQNSAPWQSTTSKEQNNSTLPSMSYVKQEPVDQPGDQQHKGQLSISQGLSSTSAVQIEQGNSMRGGGGFKDESLEKQSSRMSFPSSPSMVPSISVSSSMTTQLDQKALLGSRISSATSLAGVNAKTPPKKPSIGQKKPLDGLGSSPPLSSKKQKVSGAFLDQSIEQLNDVTAVSGVNLREEEEQLFSGPKEDSRISEASRRAVQEEEERLILQKAPLQKKLEQIMAKCGIKSISNDVERCLSLCVAERMRGLISNLIRLSKQRMDIEKSRHRTFISSDVRQQIAMMNRKAREEWEKKQAEAEKLRKPSDTEGGIGTDGDKERDDGRAKSLKVNKEEDDKMRATAANVAARAAVGGDDMLSKWQLMAEQARQKREGTADGASSFQPSKDVTRKALSTSGKSLRDSQEQEKSSPVIAASSAARKSARNQVSMPQNRVARNISVKDVIAVLEREPQMSKSTLIYRLYDKVHPEAAVE